MRRLPSLLDDDGLDFPSPLAEDRFWSMPAVFNAPFFRKCGLPAVNIKENTKSIDLEMAVPGYAKKDLKVSVSDHTLTISSERRKDTEEEKSGYTRHEFSYESFERSFQLPDHADAEKVTASHADGVLRISIPKTKAAPAAKGKEVRIV